MTRTWTTTRTNANAVKRLRALRYYDSSAQVQYGWYLCGVGPATFGWHLLRGGNQVPTYLGRSAAEAIDALGRLNEAIGLEVPPEDAPEPA